VITPFNQPLDEPALAAQAPLQASHPAIIVLVIIAKKVQQAMQGQHPQLDCHGMAGLPGLTGCNSCSNHDIAEFTRLLGGERQHVCYPVFTSVTTIQRADTGIRHDRHRHLAAGAGGGHRLEPARQPRGPQGARSHDVDNQELRRRVGGGGRIRRRSRRRRMPAFARSASARSRRSLGGGGRRPCATFAHASRRKRRMPSRFAARACAGRHPSHRSR